MEEETRFVSSGSTKLPTLLAHLLHDLNTHRKATLVGKYTCLGPACSVPRPKSAICDHKYLYMYQRTSVTLARQTGGLHRVDRFNKCEREPNKGETEYT